MKSATAYRLLQPLEALKDRCELGHWLNKNEFFGLGAEIGVAYAENACDILSHWRGSGMFLIDPWKLEDCREYVDGSAKIDFDGAYDYALGTLRQFVGRSIILRMTSDKALKLIPDGMLDFVYLDGNHHNPQFHNDLISWKDKVKLGGLVGGHDYYDRDEPHYKCEVKSTVDQFAKNRSIKLYISSPNDAAPSWWFINREII